MNAIEKEKLFWSILFREGFKQAKQGGSKMKNLKELERKEVIKQEN